MKLRYVGVALAITASLAVHAVASTTGPGNSAAAPAEPPYLSGGAQDILKLSRAKVNDDVTVAFIKNGDRRFNLTASEVVYLRQEGVSDQVLATMLGHQPEPLPASSISTAPAAPMAAPVASAPQYVEPPATTAMAETASPSTVYVVPSTPSYYSFYDPSPYWYDPWPYYGYCGYGYPYFSFGWGWGWGWGYAGNCYYGYHGYCWDDDHGDHDNHSESHNDNHSGSHNGDHSGSHDGNSSSTTRVPPTRNGSASSRSGDLATSSSRPSAGMNQTASTAGSRSVATRSARTTPVERSTSSGTVTAAASPTSQSQGGERSAPASRTVASRTGANAAAPASAVGSQSARPTSTWSGNADNRSVAARPVESQGSAQLARGYSARPTSAWNGGASQGSVTRPTANQSAVAVAPSSRVSTGPTTTWTSVGGQTANRSVARPTTSYTSYQRSSPSYSSRGGGSGASYSRPSMSAPTRSMGSSSAVRSGGSYGGGGRPSMSSGGGSRGGGGGGRSR